jgi:hypothetical protein
MGRLRGALKKLQRAAEGRADYFELADGTRFWYDPSEVFVEVFKHGSESMRADFRDDDRPPPPEILLALTRAKDRRAAVSKLYPKGSTPVLCYDVDVLVERGELVPRSILAGCDDYGESRKRLSRSGDLSEGAE